MRLSGIAALATLCCLVGAPATSAKNMAGKFGAGYNQTLLGVRGLTFGYWSGTDLQLSMTVGSGFVLDASNSNTTTILASVGFKYVMVATKFANLSAGVRADLGWSSRQESTTAGATTPKDTTGVTSGPTTNVTQWGVEAPIEVEYFFSDSFSIFMATGVTFTMVPKGGPLLTQQGLGSVDQVNFKGVGLGVGGLFGSAGFAFYF